METFRTSSALLLLPLLVGLTACAGSKPRPEAPPEPPPATARAPMPPATAPHLGLRERLAQALEEADPNRRAVLLQGLVDDLPEGTEVRSFVAGLLVQTYAELGELDRMAEVSKAAPLENDLSTADMLNAMAYAYAEAGTHLPEADLRVGQALQILDLLAAQVPASAAQARAQLEVRRGAYLDTLGWVRYRLGDLPAARAALEKAVAIYDDAETRYHLGVVLVDQGEIQAGARELARAVALGGESSPKARAVLDGLKGVDADALVHEAEAQTGGGR